MNSQLDINQIHTRRLTEQAATFKILEEASDGELQLSMLHFVLPNGEVAEISSQSFILIGRQEGNGHHIDVDLSTFGGDSGISRTHAAIQITYSAVFVRDFESRNGVYLNGEILLPMQDYVLRDGDELKLGTLKLRVIFVP
jgi:pSer/pThr/pTyr-binding forkhead associated (FHA) protein